MNTASGNRYRLVTEQQGKPAHVSSVVLGADEVDYQLDCEAMMHELCGWTVTRGPETVVARREGVLRVVSARAYGPLEDAP